MTKGGQFVHGTKRRLEAARQYHIDIYFTFPRSRVAAVHGLLALYRTELKLRALETAIDEGMLDV